MNCIRYQKEGRIAYITLNRPEVLNAMDTNMHLELKEVWDDFEQDDDRWLAVLTGAGDRSFSVGQDLKELVRSNHTSTPSTFGSTGSPSWPRLTERHQLVKPILARVNGYAFGGGFELALACDIIIAVDEARFALPEARLGLIPGAGGVFRLTRQIPFKIAIGHLMTGREMDAKRAYELGLVNEVVPRDRLDKCVERWVQEILGCAPLSVRAIKEASAASAHLSIEDAFKISCRAEELRRGSRDSREGPRAFVEKRNPIWHAE